MRRKKKKRVMFGILGILIVGATFIFIRPSMELEVFGAIRDLPILSYLGEYKENLDEDELLEQARVELSFARARTYNEVDFTMSSNQALLINLSTMDVLFEHGAHERVYPASLTKMMTVLLGITHGQGDTMIVQADFDQLLLSNASVVGFSPGEVQPASVVLHGAMLASGADATATIAHHVSRTYVDFVGLMNEKARELGMVNTHFMNSSGLHHPEHYTTAYDMAILLRYALENPTFRAIFTERQYSFIDWSGVQQPIYSTLFANISSAEFAGGRIIGGRTGFTSEAGRCLASFATDGVDEFILITFGAGVDAADHKAHFVDGRMIYNYFLQ